MHGRAVGMSQNTGHVVTPQANLYVLSYHKSEILGMSYLTELFSYRPMLIDSNK